MKKGSKTSRFGTSSRISHDSSAYYDTRLYSELPTDNGTEAGPDLEFPVEYENKILLASSERMQEIPDNSLHLMVTSPPYNVTKVYDEDLSLKEYLELLRKVFSETYRVLVGGGRACVNVANLGRRPYIPLSDFISQIMMAIGFQMRGEIIWNKGAGAGVSMAWGSWQSAANPVLRDVHEYILVFSKGSFRRKKPENKENTISREQFMEWTKSVWTMNPESARKVGHPAPFPIELPYRLIQLYTFRGDVILDPFMGSGSTAIAAVKAQRKYIGYENNPEYVKLAEERIVAFGSQLSDVEIRPWSEGDLALEERLLGDPAMTVHLGGPETAEQIRKRHARYLTTGDSGQGRMFAIVVGPGRVAAGSVGYWEREWRGQHIWEAGWSVLPEFQGQGVATRATAALVEQARAAGKHRFLHAFPSVENGPSNAICRKAGFTLQEEVEFEYPPGNLMRCNDWRLDLLADRAEQSHEPLRMDPQ